MATNTEKSPRRRGRPTRQEELRRTLAEIGVDPALIDPLRILAAIAANGKMPPTARVSACRTLLEMKNRDSAEEPAAVGDVAARAIKLMADARKAH
jgi:hypothetical protein